MDIHIRNIAPQMSIAELDNWLKPWLQQFNIKSHEAAKVKNKAWALLYINDARLANKFIRELNGRVTLRGRLVQFEKSINQDGGNKVRNLKKEKNLQEAIWFQNSIAASGYRPQQQQHQTLAVDPASLPQKQPVFVPRADLGAGRLVIGKTMAAMIIDFPDFPMKWQYRIDIRYHIIDLVVASPEPPSAVILSLRWAPKIYKCAEETPSDPIQDMFLHPAERRRREFLRKTKKRVSHITSAHKEVAGICFVYRMTLRVGHDLATVSRLFQKGPEMPPFATVGIPTVLPRGSSLKEDMDKLHLTLHFHERSKRLPYAVCFQILKLAMNGRLLPALVSSLIDSIIMLYSSYGTERTVLGLRQLYRDLQHSGPDTSWEKFEQLFLSIQLVYICRDVVQDGTAYDIIRKNPHLIMTYRIQVTPTGLYLEGPEAEVSNRVLRQYSDHAASFVRVTFGEEDGGRLDFSLNTKLDVIYSEIKQVLDHGFSICQRKFAFLGFSSSSLKSQTCWFLTPFTLEDQQKIVTASMVIEQLGDFTHFRSPAKCAARIGQAFTDTSGYLTIDAKAYARIKDIERSDGAMTRCFSDGCGTISYELVDQICSKYPKFMMKLNPVIFQIRFKGAKGMVSLDTSLAGEMICIRPSMWKFDAREASDIEVCGTADRPLTLYLNRPLIRVLDDLGIAHHVFLSMQNEMIAELEAVTGNTANAANFLETEHIANSVGFPNLLRYLDDIGIDPYQSMFLRSVIEMGALHKLRDVKYRGRIRVKHGTKLYGIMDETGFLQEGQVYCSFETPELGRSVVKSARVIVTRSPTMHPGDVQVVSAVVPPRSSTLNNLFNCIVFSQFGKRDLASQLGGGDLDGDQFDIIWDPLLVPTATHPPADYPRAQAIDIGRPVQSTDITAHFVEFMENDRVGQISSLHLQLADRLHNGTRDEQCIKLAHMASVAVDYGKTGIPVNMDERPRFDGFAKPDFMAPGPRVRIDTDDISVLIEETAEADPNDAFAALDPENRKIVYYESQSALGKLFRQIDERKFYNQLRDLTKAQKASDAPYDVLPQAFRYVKYATKAVQWQQYKKEAISIRDTYEGAVEHIQHEYALRQSQPLHELEVVTGVILGANNKRIRDMAAEMGKRFERDVAYVLDMIRGSTGDDGDVGDGEALARSIACFSLAMVATAQGGGRKKVVSWKFFAAATCLREVALFSGGALRRFQGAWRLQEPAISSRSAF